MFFVFSDAVDLARCDLFLLGVALIRVGAYRLVRIVFVPLLLAT